jgi:hypothetical protein
MNGQRFEPSGAEFLAGLSPAKQEAELLNKQGKIEYLLGHDEFGWGETS